MQLGPFADRCEIDLHQGIEPLIRARRNLEGSFALGFDEPAPESESVTIDAADSGKTDLEPTTDAAAPPAFNGPLQRRSAGRRHGLDRRDQHP